MPKVAKELSALEVKRLKAPGMHFVGGVAGLLLQIKSAAGLNPTLSSSWILRVRIGAQRRHIGLGGYPQVSLADARQEAKKQLSLIKEGIDPIVKRKTDRSRLIAESSKARTFKQCAEEYIATHNKTYSSKKHAQQWINTLEQYVYPVIGNILVSDLSRAHIIDVLQQEIREPKTNKILGKFWDVRTETASRVQGRIKSIIDYAIVAEYRTNINPAIWSGYLATQLPSPKKITKTTHHPAVPYAAMGDFMPRLRKNGSISAKALEFLILTGVRSGSVRMAEWSEVDFAKKLWIIPASHTKTKQEHRVPLSKQAVDVLESLPRIAGNPKMFPSTKGGMLSDMALSQLMRGMRERGELTIDAVPHGFRSTFRDWGAEQTNYPDEIRKAASGHMVGDAVKQAYQRTDLLEKRRKLMDEWANFLDMPSASNAEKVVAIRGKV